MIRGMRNAVVEKLSPHDVAHLKVIQRKLHHAVHNCRGGLARLAKKLGYGTPQVIGNEINPHGESIAKAGFLDVVLWVRETHDFSVLDEVDEFVGRTSYLESVTPCCASLIEESAVANKEACDVVTEVSRSMSDGRISDNELMRIERESDEAIERILSVKKRAREINANG